MLIALCDDERLMYEEVRDYIYEFNKENYLENQVVYFSKPSQLYEYMQMNEVNLIFMDLEFSKAKEDGILWSKKIKNEFPDTILIILTAYENRYKEGYEVRAWRFMTKPIVKQELFEYLQSGLEELRLSKSIAVQKRGIKRNILIKEIYYISAQSGGSELWMKSDMYYCDESLLQWEKQLPLEMFFRCHNKYLVNLCHVKEFIHQEITLVSGEKIPISRRKWKAFQIAFMKWDTKEYRR